MKLRHMTTSALALILMAACTEATGVGVEPDELAGTWTASSFILSSVEDPTVSIDLVAEEGAQMTLVLEADGTYTFDFTSNVEEAEHEEGTYVVSGNIMTVTPVTPEGVEPEEMLIVRVGDTLTLTMDDEVVFSDGGQAEAAVLVIVLTR